MAMAKRNDIQAEPYREALTTLPDPEESELDLDDVADDLAHDTIPAPPWADDSGESTQLG